jgi:hypothetical protein
LKYESNSGDERVRSEWILSYARMQFRSYVVLDRSKRRFRVVGELWAYHPPLYLTRDCPRSQHASFYRSDHWRTDYVTIDVKFSPESYEVRSVRSCTSYLCSYFIMSSSIIPSNTSPEERSYYLATAMMTTALDFGRDDVELWWATFHDSFVSWVCLSYDSPY